MMKQNLLTFVLMMLALLSHAGDRFDAVPTNQIVQVVVGWTEHFIADPFGPDGQTVPPPQFRTYFQLRTPALAQKLTVLLQEMKRSADHQNIDTPLVCNLSEQRFCDSNSNVVFTTHIVNWKSSVIIDSLSGVSDYSATGQSEEFCRTIFELMKKHCPQVIEEQREIYRMVDETLTGMLFGKDQRGTTKPSTPTN